MPRRKGEKPGTKHKACGVCPSERRARLQGRSCDTSGCGWRIEERTRSRDRVNKKGKMTKGRPYKGGRVMYVVTDGSQEKWIPQACLAKSILCDLCAEERGGK